MLSAVGVCRYCRDHEARERTLSNWIERLRIEAVAFDKELSDEAFDRLAPPARSQQARRPPGIVKHMRHAFVHIGRMTMNEKKSMDDRASSRKPRLST